MTPITLLHGVEAAIYATIDGKSLNLANAGMSFGTNSD